MVKKISFICTVGGYTSLKWAGRCPECGEWDSLIEDVDSGRSVIPLQSCPPTPVNEIPAAVETRTSTTLGEFDRMLGGGVVLGSVVLVAGYRRF